MNTSILEPASAALPHDPVQWVDALAAGTCSQEQFLAGIRHLQSEDDEATWEVLSLLDQYTRRKRISQPVFSALKTRLQQEVLGSGADRTSRHPDAAPRLPPVKAALAEQPPVAVAAPERTLRTGDLLRGRYGIVEVLRSDASGMLVEAVDELMADVPGVRHRVAIQVLNAGADRDPELIRRVCNLQGLSHPGLVRLFSIDEEHGTLFLTMELLAGVSLQQLISRNGADSLALPAALTMLRSVAQGLAYAHAQGVFHGDIRAENVLITDVGEVRLQGFEIKGRDRTANPPADRLAFAWLAYGLLSGVAVNAARPRTDTAHLREPPGLTRQQWHILRDTLLGRQDNAAGNVLTMFGAGDAAVPARITLLPAAGPAARRQRWLGSAVATVVVAALVGIAGYFYVGQGDTRAAQAGPVSPIEDAPVAQTIAAPPPASRIPAAQVAAAATTTATPPMAAPAPGYSRAIIDVPAAIHVSADEAAARIWVRRRGGLSGPVSFQWWTENGSAQSGRDFAGTEPRRAVIPDGAKGMSLLVPLVSDASRNEPRTFYIKIDAPGSGATLGERTLMQVAIVPRNYQASLAP